MANFATAGWWGPSEDSHGCRRIEQLGMSTPWEVYQSLKNEGAPVRMVEVKGPIYGTPPDKLALINMGGMPFFFIDGEEECLRFQQNKQRAEEGEE